MDGDFPLESILQRVGCQVNKNLSVFGGIEEEELGKLFEAFGLKGEVFVESFGFFDGDHPILQLS